MKNLNCHLPCLLIASIVIVALVLVGTLPLHAITMQDFVVDITFVDETNDIFNVDVGDTFLGSTTYDETFLTGVGLEALDPADPLGFFGGLVTLTVPVGNRTFIESEDDDFPNYPEIQFTDGQLSGINFLVVFNWAGFSNLAFASLGTGFHIQTEFSEHLLEGQFDLTPSSVPEPATVLLLGAGLAGLPGFRRKFKR